MFILFYSIMNNNQQILFEIINDFLSDSLDADSFEKKFTGIADFEDIDTDSKSKEYYSLIRAELERYTFSANDLERFPDYFINGAELKSRVHKIKLKYFP